MTDQCEPIVIDRAILYQGDSREVLLFLEPERFTACVCDPPYHLTQTSRKGSPRTTIRKHLLAARDSAPEASWARPDGGDTAFQPEFWAEVLRVLKPGAMLLAFGGTRTYHRLTCAIEDAGFEVRDCLMWLYGSGFPKSLDISKALDKAARGGQRRQPNPRQRTRIDRHGDQATEMAKRWDGWGSSLKPAWEPIILAMKPLDGTFAENAQSLRRRGPEHRRFTDRSRQRWPARRRGDGQQALCRPRFHQLRRHARPTRR